MARKGRRALSVLRERSTLRFSFSSMSSENTETFKNIESKIIASNDKFQLTKTIMKSKIVQNDEKYWVHPCATHLRSISKTKMIQKKKFVQ